MQPDIAVPQPSFLKILVFVALCSGLLYGYNASVYSGVMLHLSELPNLNQTRLGALVASFELAEIFGTCLAPLADRFGRRRVMLISATILALAPFYLLIDTGYTAMLLVRITTGVAAGVTFVLSFVFISEIASEAQKPILLSSVMIGVTAGGVINLALGAAFVHSAQWHWVLVLACLPALVQLAGLPGLPESTRGVAHGSPAATSASSSTLLIRHRLRQITRSPNLKRGLLLGTLVVMAGAICGAPIQIYGPLVLLHLGLQDATMILQLLIGLTVLGFLLGLMALIPIARGRSTDLLVLGLVLVSVSFLMMALSAGGWAAAWFGLGMLGFAFGIRSTVFQLLPQFLTRETRAWGMTLFNLLFLACTGLNNMLIPTVLAAAPTGLFLFYSAAALSLALMCHRFLPRPTG